MIVAHVLAGLLSSGLASHAEPETRESKVLLVFVDGFIPDALATTETPNLHRLLHHSAWSLEARAESTSISGSGWSSFLTGVHWDKHGVPDNAFEHPNYASFPHVFELVRRARPRAVLATSLCWDPIWEHLVMPLGLELASNHYSAEAEGDPIDANSDDARVTADVVRWLARPELSMAVAMFGDLDIAGHSEGNLHYDAWDARYRSILRQIDGRIGELLAAIERRPARASEDWLIVVSSDHAGALGQGHGRNVPEQRLIPLIVSGPSIVEGEILPAPSTVDIVPTALAHLGIERRAEWQLDGRVLGWERTERPKARLGANLIVNGDAELERGTLGYVGVPDVWAPGWYDPSALTVVRYGSPEFPSEANAIPAAHGANFFAGGAVETHTWIEQTIDLAPLAKPIGKGAHWELGAWLGGYGEQDDRALFSATFLDERGRILGRGVLAPAWASDRGQATGFVRRQATGEVPRAARSVRVRLDCFASAGLNDGYADELSLVIRR
jgi:hypothetical protein